MAKVIRYSDEHIHILSRRHGETCHLSRNWNRCAAGDNTMRDAEPIRKREDALYYDGNDWRDARQDHDGRR
jgi:hypothetical protein